MSSQHKLFNFQVSPPEEAWKQIALELDDLQALKPLANKMDLLEIAPPSTAWNAIAHNLDDESAFSSLQKKLSTFEVTPPLDIWDKIDLQLNGSRALPKAGGGAPVRPLQWTRYAVAACVLGLLGFVGFLLNEKSNRDTKTILSGVHQQENRQKENQSIAAITPEDKAPQTEPAQVMDQKILVSAPVAPTQIKTAAGNTYTTTVEKNKSIQGRYIMLMTEDGTVVRMSKKLGNMADCVAGESTNTDCDDQIEQWQKEIAKAPVAATPDNFLDLLDLANNETAGM